MIKQYNFKAGQYVKEVTKKSQIYLHHTAGSGDAEKVFKWWETNPERIATHFVIGADGTILQGFDLKYWAFHLGAKASTFNSMGVKYKQLDKISIGIELCNWGHLREHNGVFFNYVNGMIQSSQVTKLDTSFKGSFFFHSYTDAQIESLKELLLYINKETGISLHYEPEFMWGINIAALSGGPGLYTHNSVRRDKNDVYPCPRLIKMLEEI